MLLTWNGATGPSAEMPTRWEEFPDQIEGKINPSSLQSSQLLNVARTCEGLSGRAIRKLPFLAQALRTSQKRLSGYESFLCALQEAVTQETQDRAALWNENV